MRTRGGTVVAGEPVSAAPRQIEFFVPGIPVPGGSKRGFVVKGRAVLVDTSGRRGKNWRVSVQAAAQTVYSGPPLEGPLAVNVGFRMLRPKGHLQQGGRVRRSAPDFPTVRPDTDKLGRVILDALTGVVWRDDAQIVDITWRKLYATPPGAWVEIWRL